MRLRASLHCVFSTLMCFLNDRRESQHSPRNFVDSSVGGRLWARDRGAVKCMTLHLWAANLKPFLVAHSSMAFTACYRCLYGVQRASSKTDCQVIDKECFEDVLGNTRGQLINLQSKTCKKKKKKKKMVGIVILCWMAMVVGSHSFNASHRRSTGLLLWWWWAVMVSMLRKRIKFIIVTGDRLYYWKINCITGRPIVVLEDRLYYWKIDCIIERSIAMLEYQWYY